MYHRDKDIRNMARKYLSSQNFKITLRCFLRNLDASSEVCHRNQGVHIYEPLYEYYTQLEVDTPADLGDPIKGSVVPG